MSRLSDQTGTLVRVAGLGSLVLLVATAVFVREPPPAPPTPEAAPPAEPVPPVAVEPVRPPETSRLQRLFPAFPRTTLIPMGMLETNGNPTEMAFFETEIPAGEVLEFYARDFRRRGYHVVNEPDGTGGGAVNYYDPQLGALVSVTAMGLGGKPPRTMVFPSIIETPEGVHLQGSAPASLPTPPGAMTVLRVDEREKGPSDGSSTVTQVAHGTPQMLADFYKEKLSGQGYVQADRRLSKGVEMLDFERPGERISVSVSPLDKEGLPESLITLVVERGSSTKELKR